MNPSHFLSIIIAGLAIGFGIAHHGRYVAISGHMEYTYTLHDTWTGRRVVCTNGGTLGRPRCENLDPNT